MAMLHLFLRLGRDRNWRLAVAHFHHGLRGRSADADAKFVRTFCLRHAIPYYEGHGDARALAIAEKRSLEESARTLRYAFLEKTAARCRYAYICTAHHLSDQAETVIMRIVKGTGLRGLFGIRAVRKKIIRPLLTFSSHELASYARERKVRFRTDRSNSDETFLRNKVRRRVMPMLRSVDPRVEDHLSQLAWIAGSAHDALLQWAEGYVRPRLTKRKIVLEIPSLRNYFFSQVALVLEIVIQRLSKGPVRLQFSDYENLWDLIQNQETDRRVLIENIECRRDRQRLVISTRNRQRFVASRRVVPGNSYAWHGMTFTSRVSSLREFRSQKAAGGAVEFFDADRIDGSLRLRPWKDGDRFYPLGMRGSKLVSDVLTDRKVSAERKSRTMILAERRGKEERIVWVCGYRMDDRYKIQLSTKSVLRCEFGDEQID